MPVGMETGNWTASWSGQSAGCSRVESSLSSASSTRPTKPSQALWGLSERSSQETRSAIESAVCTAFTHTPDTAGANHRSLRMICPTSGNQYVSTAVQAESSGAWGSARVTSGAWITSLTTGASPGDRLRTYCAMRSEEHTSELQSHHDLVCRLLL